MKTHKEFLIETLLYYSEDTGRRATNPNGEQACLYLRRDGAKCAIGRHIIEGKHSLCEGQTIYWINVQGFIPEIEHLDTGFLGEVQLFHDTSVFWNRGNGITNDGVVEFVKLLHMAETFDLSIKQPEHPEDTTA